MTKRTLVLVIIGFWLLQIPIYFLRPSGIHLTPTAAVINGIVWSIAFTAFATIMYHRRWRIKSQKAATTSKKINVLDDFLVQYISYCACVEASKIDGSARAKSNAVGMATIALDDLWKAHRACRDAGISTEEIRSAMQRLVPEYANVALF